MKKNINSSGNVHNLAARAAEVGSKAKAARLQARLAKVALKTARKAYKQAKKVAKEIMVQADVAQHDLKVASKKAHKQIFKQQISRARISSSQAKKTSNASHAARSGKTTVSKRGTRPGAAKPSGSWSI